MACDTWYILLLLCQNSHKFHDFYWKSAIKDGNIENQNDKKVVSINVRHWKELQKLFSHFFLSSKMAKFHV